MNTVSFESFPKGISNGFSTLGLYIKQFKLVFTKEGVQQLGGFGSIGQRFFQKSGTGIAFGQ